MKLPKPPTSVPRPLPEGHDALKQVMFDMLGGDDYWHRRIKRALLAKGFEVRIIHRESDHAVWSFWASRGTFALSRENKVASRQIREVLVGSGIQIKPKELNVFEQHKDGRLKATFIFEGGAGGFFTD